ncbi:MAG: Rid family hydrolase [Pseudomonadales bacterium]|nr:Rid family hydrolase [Pseudomonadales bacterium]
MTRLTRLLTATTSSLLLMFAVSASAQDEIVRQGEGRLFYNSITIPPGAETLYMSGSGASRQEDGTYGDTYQQTVNTFEKFKASLEELGWSMSDIVMVRVYGVAGPEGKFDFANFNRAYTEFFGTEENPQKPVRAVVEVAAMVVDGWLLEIEIRAARVKQ